MGVELNVAKRSSFNPFIRDRILQASTLNVWVQNPSFCWLSGCWCRSWSGNILEFSKHGIRIGNGRHSFDQKMGGLTLPPRLWLTQSSWTYNPSSITTLAPLFLLWRWWWMGECVFSPYLHSWYNYPWTIYVHIENLRQRIIWLGFQHSSVPFV